MQVKCRDNLNLSGKKITLIGSGLIGASWAALFLFHKMKVTICDPKNNIEEVAINYIKNALSELSNIKEVYPPIILDNNLLTFEKELSLAVEDADYIQENATENKEIKINLWQQIEKYAPKYTHFYSSSSTMTATQQSEKLIDKARLIVGHPFNPPHLVPLVEVVPGKVQCIERVNHAMDFYYALGKKPQLIKKEITSFVANRLQSVVFREAIYLVQQGIVDAKELDLIVRDSLGLRWATAGPLFWLHIGGGDNGIANFLNHFAPVIEKLWHQQTHYPLSLDNKTNTMLAENIAQSYSKEQTEKLKKIIYQKEIALLKLSNQSEL